MNESIVMEVLNNKVPLDQKCWCCVGGAVDPKKPEHVNVAHLFTADDCDICNGVGYTLTDAGQAVMDLVKRHGG